MRFTTDEPIKADDAEPVTGRGMLAALLDLMADRHITDAVALGQDVRARIVAESGG